MPEIRVCSDALEVSEEAARLFVATATGGAAHIALSGGSTPRELYRRLSMPPFAKSIPWQNTHLYWGDERCVPPDHSDSNYRMVRETLLDHVRIPAANIHRIPAELDPATAAELYERELPDRLDLIFLGPGEDGHTASLFPDSEALGEMHRRVVANYIPRFNSSRITLTPPYINRSQKIVFLVTHTSKGAILREVFNGPPGKYPAQLIHAHLLLTDFDFTAEPPAPSPQDGRAATMSRQGAQKCEKE